LELRASHFAKISFNYRRFARSQSNFPRLLKAAKALGQMLHFC